MTQQMITINKKALVDAFMKLEEEFKTMGPETSSYFDDMQTEEAARFVADMLWCRLHKID